MIYDVISDNEKVPFWKLLNPRWNKIPLKELEKKIGRSEQAIRLIFQGLVAFGRQREHLRLQKGRQVRQSRKPVFDFQSVLNIIVIFIFIFKSATWCFV